MGTVQSIRRRKGIVKRAQLLAGVLVLLIKMG
jgi:hypothetical protein